MEGVDPLDIPGRIDRSCPIPYYYQLQEILRAWIEDDALAPHTRIPSGAEFEQRFNVSRTVVRRALRRLELEGLIYREKGRGSFVAQPKLRQQISELTSFTEDVRARGARAGAHVLRQEMVSATELVARKLEVSSALRVFCLKRVRYSDESPLAIETAYLGFDGCEALLEEDFENRSLYKSLALNHGIRPCQAEQELEAAIIQPRESEWLEVDPGTPVMLIRRTTYDVDGQPIEFVNSVYRGDRYKFVAQLRVRQP